MKLNPSILNFNMAFVEGKKGTVCLFVAGPSSRKCLSGHTYLVGSSESFWYSLLSLSYSDIYKSHLFKWHWRRNVFSALSCSRKMPPLFLYVIKQMRTQDKGSTSLKRACIHKNSLRNRIVWGM